MAAARALRRRAQRERTGRFLVEGAPAVHEAVACGTPLELFVTDRAGARHPELLDAAAAAGARVSVITERAAAGLSETRTPQGVVAVCPALPVPAPRALAQVRLAVILAGVADPGNAGTVMRVADAAGAGAALLAGRAVDPHNGKCVRASAGSVFHLALAREPDPLAAIAACHEAGLAVMAADGATGRDLDEAVDGGSLRVPAAWLFGSEAHGLAPELLDAADDILAVPIHGRAESLNLAGAAAVCLYRAARAHRGACVHAPSSPVN